MVENAIADESFKHAVPLSPQWLASKNGDAKGVSDLPSTPKGIDLDVKRGGGEAVDKKKDWWRTAGMGERWREDERDTNLGSRRWIEPHASESYDGGRRDGKWSNRWGPDDKEKEFRRGKWDGENRERYVPNARRDGEREGWHLHTVAKPAQPRVAPGSAGRGRGFSAGRGRATLPPGSYSAALSGTASRPAIGAVAEEADPLSNGFKYPRAKLLDIYRSCGGRLAFSETPQNMANLADVTESTAQDPIAFISPKKDEKVALDSVWNAKSVSVDVQKGTENVGNAKENDENDRPEVNGEPAKEKLNAVVEETEVLPDIVAVPEKTDLFDEVVDAVSRLEVQTNAVETKKAAPEELYLRYVDPQGVVQGPFSGRDILTWYEAEYFTAELLVREDSAPDTAPFVPLKDVMPHLVNSPVPVHKTAEDEFEGLKDFFSENVKKSNGQTDALSSVRPVEVSLPSTESFATPVLSAQHPLFGIRDDRLVQQYMQKERSYGHDLAELELAQLQQVEQARQHLQQPPLHVKPAFLDSIHNASVQRAIDRSLDPLRREQLQQLIEQQAFQNEYALYLEKQFLQQHGERLASDQYLQMMQTRHQQDIIFQVLQQQQKQHELRQQKQHELQQKQKQHELLQHELLQHELLQQKHHDRELNRLLTLQQQMNYPERRISGVWKVDESGLPMRVMENIHHPRLHHQSSLPAVFNRDSPVSFDDRDRGVGNLDLRVAGMQRPSNEIPFLQQQRHDALQALRMQNWNMHDQYIKELERGQVSVPEHPVIQSQKSMSSQDFIHQQLMRNQQLHERKVKIDQHMREMQPSLEKLWSGSLPRSGALGNLGMTATNASEMYVKQSVPLPEGYASGSVSTNDGSMTDDFHGPVREVESRKLKVDASNLQGRKFENGIANHSQNMATRAAEVSRSLGMQDFESTKFPDMKSNGFLPQAAQTSTEFPTLSKGSAIPLAPQSLYTTAEVKTFRRWCETQIKELTGNSDMSRLEHCMQLPSVLEAEHFLTQYLGNSPTAQAFKGEFLRCRELMTPQMMQVFGASSEGKNASSDQTPAAKKKTKKVKRIDPSLLGFNVTSNRILMGEIHHVDA